MPLPDAFWEQLPHKTDLELYEVLVQQQDYLPEAVAAVAEEMRKRKLSPERLAETAAAADEKRMLALRTEAQEQQKRRVSGWAFHVFVWLAIPLALFVKRLISVLMGP